MTKNNETGMSAQIDGVTGARRGTPYVAVDHERMIRNINAMQERATMHGVRLRPHVKTHKCLEIARLQLAAGAVGLTASKADEALIFMQDGVKSIIVAYPMLDPHKLDRLLQASIENETEIAFIADSAEGVTAIQLAALRHQLCLPIYLKMDVGLGRIGIPPGSARLITLAAQINSAHGLKFAGLLSHAGNAYAATSVDQVKSIARREIGILEEAKNKLESELGIKTPHLSVGATPTALADAIHAPTTEIRPGNYVFSDLTQLRIGVCTTDDLALSVVVSIISVNNDHYIIDAGSKLLSSDLGPHGTGLNDPVYGMASTDQCVRTPDSWLPVVMLSEEHGFVRRVGTNLALGTRLRIFPKHSCSVVNLTDVLIIEKDGKPHAEWAVAARGRTQ